MAQAVAGFAQLVIGNEEDSGSLCSIRVRLGLLHAAFSETCDRLGRLEVLPLFREIQRRDAN